MFHAGRGHDQFTHRCSFFLVTNHEKARAFEYEIELISSLMGVRLLYLARLKAVQSHHYRLTLPQSGLKKLFRGGACMFLPVQEIIHMTPSDLTTVTFHTKAITAD